MIGLIISNQNIWIRTFHPSGKCFYWIIVIINHALVNNGHQRNPVHKSSYEYGEVIVYHWIEKNVFRQEKKRMNFIIEISIVLILGFWTKSSDSKICCLFGCGKTSHICYDLKTYIKLMLILTDKPTMKNVCWGQVQNFGLLSGECWLARNGCCFCQEEAGLFCLFHQQGEEGDGESGTALKG